MASASHAGGGQSASARPSPAPLSFRRVRLVTQEDFYAGYAIVASYINNPGAAGTVEACVVDPSGRNNGYPFDLEMGATPMETGTVDDAAHRSIEEYAGLLRLGEDIIRHMSESFERRKQKDMYGFSVRPHHDFNLTVATLLISLCPNITSLRLWGVRPSTPLGQFLLNNNYGKTNKPALQKLREIQLHPVNCLDVRQYESYDSLDYVRYFHRLPAVKSLSLEGLEEYQAEAAFFPPKSSARITKLNFSHVHMSADYIGTIIRIPKSLEVLSISNRGLQTLEGNYEVDGRTVGQCLLEHKDCLTELNFDMVVHGSGEGEVRDLEDEEWEREEEMKKWYFSQDQQDGDSRLPLRLEDLPTTREYPARSIGSMHDFTALTRLSIVLFSGNPVDMDQTSTNGVSEQRIGAILGYDDTEASWRAYRASYERFRALAKDPLPDLPARMTFETHVPSASYRLIDALPPNLEFLRLYGYRKGEVEAIDDHVRELLEKKAERFPKLREIEGVDEFLPGVPGMYGDKVEDDDIWRRPTDGLDWVEA